MVSGGGSRLCLSLGKSVVDSADERADDATDTAGVASRDPARCRRLIALVTRATSLVRRLAVDKEAVDRIERALFAGLGALEPTALLEALLVILGSNPDGVRLQFLDSSAAVSVLRSSASDSPKF